MLSPVLRGRLPRNSCGYDLQIDDRCPEYFSSGEYEKTEVGGLVE